MNRVKELARLNDKEVVTIDDKTLRGAKSYNKKNQPIILLVRGLVNKI